MSMTHYGALSRRYLKQQRKRSILTIVGIILSVALISAIGTMGQSMKDNMLSQAIYESGSYHFMYDAADKKLYDEVKNNALVDEIGFWKEGPKTELKDGFQLSLTEANPELFDLAPLHLQEGRWPANSDELVVEQWMLSRLPGSPKVGDTTEVTGPDGSPHPYKISGVINNTRSGQQQAKSKAYTLMSAGAADTGTYSLFVTLKPGVDISSHLKAFADLGGNYNANGRVLSYMGESPDDNFNQVMGVIFGTLIGLVVLSTAAVIYNIFHISVLERIRQFGLLRTLGATPSQIRMLVFREATTLAVIGIPLGLLCGWAALWAVIQGMLSAGFRVLEMEDFHLTWHTWIMAGSVLIGLLSVYLAAWLPARKAASVSPVEAVRGTGSIVRESFSRRRIPSPLQIAGVGGKMATKNIRRNRSKFRITTFSIIISVTLFIVFHYFTQEALRLTVDTNEENRIAFSIYKNYVDTSENKQPTGDFLKQDQIDGIRGIPGVRGVYGIYNSFYPMLWIPENRYNAAFESASGIQPSVDSKDGADYRPMTALLYAYDDARLKEAADYLTAGTADPQKLAAQNAVLIVQTVMPKNPDTGKRTQLDLTHYKIGDKLMLDLSTLGESNGKPVFGEVTVGGILSQAPFGQMYRESSVVAMAPLAVYGKLVQPRIGEDAAFLNRYGIDIALTDDADDKAVRQTLNDRIATMPDARLIDVAAEQKQSRQFNLQMQIFVYGFLLVIGGIGSLNIINTVQTNLLLRRREFGLLQAVGMTTGQLKRMTSLEGLWFGFLGSFWGLAFGTGLSYFLYVEMSGLQGGPFHFPWGGAIIACGAALAVGLLSVLGPMRRIGRMNLIESLREEA